MLEGVVVGEVAQALHLNELVCKVLNLLWKPPQDTLGTPLSALLFDSSVI